MKNRCDDNCMLLEQSKKTLMLQDDFGKRFLNSWFQRKVDVINAHSIILKKIQKFISFKCKLADWIGLQDIPPNDMLSIVRCANYKCSYSTGYNFKTVSINTSNIISRFITMLKHKSICLGQLDIFKLMCAV